MHKGDYIKGISEKAERRFFLSNDIEKAVEVRMNADGIKTFRGYFLKFNTFSEDMGGFRERIAPGFLDNVLGNDVRILFNHEPNLILGRTTAGTAKIGVDKTGGWYEYTDPNTSYSRDLAISIERGDVTQSSFAFSLGAGGDQWSKDGGQWVRTLLSANNLLDASPVTYPAYPDTAVGARSLDIAMKEQCGEARAIKEYVEIKNYK